MTEMIEEGIRYIPIQALGKTYSIWTKKIGNNPKVKILLLHGGPGINHLTFKCFEDYLPKDDFEFYYYDQLGSYMSDHPNNEDLWTIDRFVDEVEQVRQLLNLNQDNFYLFGFSWGGILAMEYALKYQQHMKGMIVSSMQASGEDYISYCNNVLVPQLDLKIMPRIREIEAQEDYDNPEYELLLRSFYQEFVLRISPKKMPEPLIESYKYLNRQVYHKLNGPSEFGLKGTLKTWNIKSRLKNIKVPTLFMGSTYNTTDPEQMRWMASEVKDGEYHHCDNGSHFAMWDDAPTFFDGLIGYINRLENKLKNRRIIEEIMALKIKAIQEKNLDLYLSTISIMDEHYLNEQKHWFEAMIDSRFKNLSFTIINVQQIDNLRLKAIIRQKHTYYEDFDFTYPLIFNNEDGSYKDKGYDFKIIDTPRYIIRYMPDDDRIEAINEMINTAFNRVEDIFHKKVDEKPEFKLYSNNELMRQQTKPNINWLFHGWGESDESIKLYTGLENISSYHGLIQHELVHQLTLHLSHGHTAQWLSEGLSVTYGNADYDLKDDLIYSHINEFDLKKTINEIEEFDLYNATDMDKITEWYCTCGSYVNFLLDQFGHEKVMEILYEADRISQTYNTFDKFTSIKTTKEAIENVLGKTEEDISHEYLQMR